MSSGCHFLLVRVPAHLMLQLSGRFLDLLRLGPRAPGEPVPRAKLVYHRPPYPQVREGVQLRPPRRVIFLHHLQQTDDPRRDEVVRQVVALESPGHLVGEVLDDREEFLDNLFPLVLIDFRVGFVQHRLTNLSQILASAFVAAARGKCSAQSFCFLVAAPMLSSAGM